ncbi:MAG: TolC family protein, partial [Bryobacteraceae bacterium]
MKPQLRIGCCLLCSISTLLAQQPASIAPPPAPIAPPAASAPRIVRPYLPREAPPIRMGNSSRLDSLIRAGALYLTVQDAIALALENNLALEVARYNPLIAQWQLERSKAGGALPGVPSGASQVGSVASGQGIAGSQAAAGVTTNLGNGRGGAASNATVAEIGPITETLDPTLQESSVFTHQTQPQQNNTQSAIPVLISGTRNSSMSYQQGFLIGGDVSATFRNSYLNENAPTDVLNPSSAPVLSVLFQQNLLRGFGVAVNSRTIRVSQLNVRESELNFKTQVIGVIDNVLSVYYGLVADDQDLRWKQNAVNTAQQLLTNTQRQQQAGTVA